MAARLYDAGRERIGAHRQEALELHPRLVPLARVVTEQLGQVSDRRRVGRVERLGARIQPPRIVVAAVVLGCEDVQHDLFDSSAARGIQDSVGEVAGLHVDVLAELLSSFAASLARFGKRQRSAKTDPRPCLRSCARAGFHFRWCLY